VTSGAASSAEDFGCDGLFGMLGCPEDLVAQLKRGLRAAKIASVISRASARESGGRWESRRKARPGHWGGGFAGSWGGGFGGPGGGGPWGGPFGGPRGPWWMGPPGPGGPPGKARPKASRGEVRAAILALLREGPHNGYQIMSEIGERSGGAWRPSPGAVYPALSQLEDEGLIVADESGARRTFILSEAGREYVEQNPDMARGAWESTAQQEAWEVPGLFAQAARLGAGIVQVAHAGTAEQVAAAERLLQRTRRELYRLLAEEDQYTDDSADNDTDDDDDEQEG
jgi:DNA-binding PadR family transcriptional regulator